MKKIKLLTIIENLLWIINPCLIVLCIFSNQLHIGRMLSWLGQWHPVILHFPIVIGICISCYLLANFKPSIKEEIEKYLFTFNALFASLVALLGIFISIGGNYDKSILNIHQWGGLFIALLSWSLLLIDKNYLIKHKTFRIFIGSIYFLSIIVFTHKGGQLTHGSAALAIPNKVVTETTINKPDSLLTVYEKAVHPILLNKCISCHGGDKIKGDLQLTSIEFIKKGGKHKDQITDRIHLPLSDEKHMPPTDNKQLTKDELAIITKWMQLGGDLNKALKDLSKTDSLYILASQYIAPTIGSNKEQPDLTAYNNNYVSVQYNYHGGDKIDVNFFQGAFYKTEYLQKLEKIKDQIVTLNMQNIPLKKSDVDIIVTFSNVEKLNLNYTKLNINDIAALTNLKKLKSISLAGMIIDNNKLELLLKGSNIKTIQLWENGLKQKDIAPIALKYPGIQFVVGDNLEDSIMKLNKPLIEQDSTIITNSIYVPIKHFLKGVTIKYTLDDTEPDSITSPIYNSPIVLTKNTTLKTKAFKKGWLASDMVQKSFYKSSLSPDTIILLTKPDPKYVGSGGHTIIDHELGELNFGGGKWLGYSKTNMEFVMKFNKATALNEIIFNALINTSSYIFPIQTIQVEASDDGKQFKTIQTVNFTSITKAYTKEPNINQAQAFKIKVPKGKAYAYYKFTLRNLKQLPVWHPGKGTPAWIFVDEVFFN
jgi:hypothetical protein